MPAYQTKQERIAVRGVADLNIRSLLDREQFADPLGAALRLGISSASWPLFGLLWPSGAELAARLALRPVCRAERILEIGCGLALASLVAHRRGADVTACDRHPLAAGFLAENLRLNDLAPLRYRHGDWDAGAPAPSGLDATPNLAATERFELIIGSDVLYERDQDGLLAAFIGSHACPAAEVWIVDPNRGNRPAFNARMVALGFSVGDLRLDRAASAGADGFKGRLLTYRRAAADGRV